MGLIPDDVIEAVRLRSDIVEVVSRHVQLKKKGKYFTGYCPFHKERSPSFTVTPDKQIFHCFGCNTGGNVFKFLMLIENVTFVEAVKMLAQRAGISLPANESPAEQERRQKLAQLRQINSLANDYFRNVFKNHGAAGRARSYLAERGLSQDTLENFQVGFTLPEWDSLLKFMEKQGYRPQTVAEAGLAVKNESGRYYDRFRERIIFPIWDVTGRVIGFGGRVVNNTATPKYLNSPETVLFSKGHLLYGLHLARRSIKEKGYVVIMEGYMDVVTAHRYGITNAVASLGTSLTREQGRLLINYSRNVVIAYDADAAGVAATLRGLELLQEIGCQVRVVNIPEGQDPDDFLRRHGRQGWEDLIEQAFSLIEYKLRQAVGNKPVRTVSEKLEVMRLVFPGVAGIKSEIEREESLKTISRFLSSSPEAVTAEFKRFQANSGKKWTNPDNIVKTKHNIIINKENKLNSREKAENGLLRLVLEDPSLVEIILKELGEEPFRNTSHKNIFKQFLIISREPFYQPAKIFNYLKDDEQPLLSQFLLHDIPGENRVQIMKDYLESIHRCNRQERREKLIKEIGDAEKSGDHDLYGYLWREYIILRGIAEAERIGDHDRLANLLHEYQQFLKTDTWKHPKEGSESAERRS
ncbi:DNA primase [Pelotomaculum terephthalicicum JT]|uniref:DNA primase n=1 Tax=Pelotomaculum TaxID=191373 RepID=UPI0009C5D46E|nr:MULTISPECIES: DNA primase [Pelotomaculum]MCG9967073.1 DNA primase [Pelotomaculum terephthalicicum JT]OPX89260.1 MAG: DNA primase [Pelotomaculum sp. PtaB.Bin117]